MVSRHPTPLPQPTSPTGSPTNLNTGQSFEALTHATPNGYVGPPPVPHPAPAQQLNPSIAHAAASPHPQGSQRVNSNPTPQPFTHSLMGPFISHGQFRMTAHPLQVAYPSQQPIVSSRPEAMNNPMPFAPSIEGQKSWNSLAVEYKSRNINMQHNIEKSPMSKAANQMSAPSTQVTSPSTCGKKRGRPLTQKTPGCPSRCLRRASSPATSNDIANRTRSTTHTSSGVTIVE
ncbi:hypothetical protein M422DRAFT_249732 [Sphaerobolus stellatus SS14]|uniref:Uncharacterized protein n=1 Tax=Sphaerobolus stellatus (strain SS14) TaxID=990650 RepID=A0A0C9W3I0_SPHS4|nr:hypothetical protein M422DRAFT_249732 [Sphaerobolus stellatus SS14]